MNCQEFWNTMPELGEADPGAVEHARECPACAASLETHGRLAGGLRSLSADCRRTEAPARVEARLRARFRDYSGLGAAPSWRTAWVPVLTMAGAVAAVLVLGIFLVRGHQPQPAARRAPARLQARMELAQAAPLPAPELYADALDPQSGFITLAGASENDAGDGVNLVRLELPRSSMIALGYAVSADRAADTVEAEVVLGPDGLARAVRFLDE